jgi:DNA mismatch endonuclease (patch repair protein)
MQRQARQDTAPERALRSAVHRLGLRYRVHVRPLPNLRREADLVFCSAGVAVFVDGCFWHGCPEHSRQPGTNTGWWQEKLARNRARDAEPDRILEEAGWRVIRIWEHEDPKVSAARVAEVVHGARKARSG